jgi:ribosomal protein S18 acetylase RimI-like enzyme
MTSPLHLLPGAEPPRWVTDLEQTTFQDAWGPLAGHEHLLALEPEAYCRWAVVPAAQEAELLRIAVAPEARRRGQGRQLLEASEAFLLAQGIRLLHLEVRCSNQAARHLYESTGWTLQRIRTAYYRDGEDAAIYGKALRPGPPHA